MVVSNKQTDTQTNLPHEFVDGIALRPRTERQTVRLRKTSCGTSRSHHQ